MIIAGAAKAGTTSLLRYLGQHPEVCPQREPEFTYFVLEEQHARGYEAAFERYFGDCGCASAIVAKNVGLMYSPDGLRRLRSHNPAMQVVVLLRHPVERSYSHYWYARQLGHEPLASFERAIEAEPDRLRSNRQKWARCAYLERSDYARHLETVYGMFPRPQITVATTEELEKDPTGLCRTLCRRLGVSADFTVDTSLRHNVTGVSRSSFLARAMRPRTRLARAVRTVLPRQVRAVVYALLLRSNLRPARRPEMNRATRASLEERFSPMIARLEEMVGRSLW